MVRMLTLQDRLWRRVHHRLEQRKGESSGGVMGNRSEFWRELSWRVGDQHAHRICWLVDGYCRLVGLSKSRFHQRVPR